MHPDLVLFGIISIAIFILTIRIIYFRIKGKSLDSKWTRAISHLGQVSLGLGVLLQVVELATALESVTSTLTPEEIAKGLSSTLYPGIHGLIVYVIALTLYAFFRLTEKEALGDPNPGQL